MVVIEPDETTLPDQYQISFFLKDSKGNTNEKIWAVTILEAAEEKVFE